MRNKYFYHSKIKIQVTYLIVGIISLTVITLKGIAQPDTLLFHPVNNKDLQQCEIRNITGTADGKIWLSTNKGIAGFDGNEVHFFGHIRGDIKTIWSSSVSFLQPVPDAKGNLYVATVTGHTYYFDTKTGRVQYLDIRKKSEDSSFFVYPKPYADIYIENDTSIWGGRYNMGFLKYNPVGKQTKCYTLISAVNRSRNTVNMIMKDSKNADLLWLATNNGIYSFDKKKEILHQNFNEKSKSASAVLPADIISLDVANEDTIWFVCRTGVGCYEIKKGVYTIYPHPDLQAMNQEKFISFNYFKRKSENEYYVVFADGLPAIFNTQTQQYSFSARIVKELPRLKLQSFFADNAGNCWAVIYGQLYYASNKENKFKSKSIIEPLRKEKKPLVFKTIIWNNNKQVYYAAFDNSTGILVLNKEMEYIRTIPFIAVATNSIAAAGVSVSDMLLDNNGRFWANGDVLYLYDSVQSVMQPIMRVRPELKKINYTFQNIVFRQKYIYAIPGDFSKKAIYRLNTDELIYDSILLPKKMFDESGKSELGIVEVDHHSKYAYLSNGRVLYQLNLDNKSLRMVKGMQFTTMPYSFFKNFHWYNVDDDDNLWVSSFGIIRVFEPGSLNELRKEETDPDSYLLQTVNLSGRGIMAFYYSTGLKLFDYKKKTNYNLSLNNNLIAYLNPTILFANISLANNYLFAGVEIDALQYINLNSLLSPKKPRSCYLSNIQVFNKLLITDTLPEYLQSLKLSHKNNFITLTFSSTEFGEPEGLEYRYRLSGIEKEWIYANYLNRTISYPKLSAGKYDFFTSIKNEDGSWSDSKINLHIIITPPFWQTGWFITLSGLLLFGIVYYFIRSRIQNIRIKEKQKALHEKELIELEAKALRSQMNPHFIFNCLNSIKSLIQDNQSDKSVTYLTTFSKLIRTLFNNADKKEITLYDEIETCKLYLQLEAMRFDTKFSYSVNMDNVIDLKSVQVPALIIQPFIENAIWHGIVPKQTPGHMELIVKSNKESIEIIIDDNGIGREAALQKKSASGLVHQSKGVNLTQSRLELDNLLQQRQASIETIDKKDEMGKSTGTRVIIKIKHEL